MTDERLKEIEAAHRRIDEAAVRVAAGEQATDVLPGMTQETALHEADAHRGELLVEVRRLRDEVARHRQTICDDYHKAQNAVEHAMRERDAKWAERDEARAEAAHLRETIRGAPHDPGCEGKRLQKPDYQEFGRCSCWKSRALGGTADGG